MKLLSIDVEPLTAIPFLNAGRRRNDFFVDRLLVLHGQVDALPHGLSSLVVTADLQGRETLPESPRQPLRLLGEVLPGLISATMEDLGAGSTYDSGIILAGDFYTYPDLHGRGGTGDVTSVWQSFADTFKLVIGVAGNHDTFGDDGRGNSIQRPPRMGEHVHFLDDSRIEYGDLHIGGVSGVIGNPRKNFRRTHEDFILAVQNAAAKPTDILILHDGPDAPEKGCRGIPEVREVLERRGDVLVIRGHKHWPTPFVELENGVGVLNVEATVVILTANG